MTWFVVGLIFVGISFFLKQFKKDLIASGFGVFPAIVLVSGLFFVLCGLNPFTITAPGNRKVVIRLGSVQDRVLDEGVNLIMPLVDSTRTIEVRTVKYEVKAEASSKDLQTVDAIVAINYHLNAKGVNKLYQEVGDNYVERIIDPAIQETIKAITAIYNVEELITKRENVKTGIITQLKERMVKYHIIVDEVNITNFTFSKEFNDAIEKKQVAVQDALTSQRKLEQVKFEAEQLVATAKAQAESIRIQAQAINSQGGKDYCTIKWIEAWKEGGSQVPNIVTSNQGGSFIMDIGNLNK